MLTVFDKILDWLRAAKFGKWCLIAGTPVMTMAGPLPVEQIEPGMMVLSAPESGSGAPSFRPVAGLSRNRIKEVARLAYDHDDSAATANETITSTCGHPFWVEERAAFVPAVEIEPGEHLRLAGGTCARVSSVEREAAPGGAGLAVYNFAVADHQTYFAGTGGVWTHNRPCHPAVEKARGTLRGMLRDGRTYDEAADLVVESLVRDLPQGTRLQREELFEAVASVLEDHPKFAADTYNPLAELAGLRSKLRLGDGGTLAIARFEGEARPAFGINPNWTSSDPVKGFKPLKSKLLDRVNQRRATDGLPALDPVDGAHHAEALSLIRNEERLGGPGALAGKRAELVVDRPPCRRCMQGLADSGGLAAVSKTMELQELVVRCEKGFEFDTAVKAVQIDANGVITAIVP